MDLPAVISDIQRFCVHDGPGIRTTIFFKGCGLRCSWCQNPESWMLRPELAVTRERCILCSGEPCVRQCPLEAILLDPSGCSVDWARCNDCGMCTSVCPTSALRMVGSSLTLSAVLSTCLEDESFYGASGGGVTLSGGEPVLQSEFCLALSRRLRERNISVWLQTAGQYPFGQLERLLGEVDGIMFDLKLPSTAGYALHCGVSETLALENLEKLVAMRGSRPEFPQVVVRAVVVPEITESHAGGFAEWLTHRHIHEVTLLDYHDAWTSKRQRLRPRNTAAALPRDTTATDRVAARLVAGGLRVSRSDDS